jgi:DNA repair protein RadC
MEDRLGIKAWAEEDRPREKLIQKGRSALTEAELIAILIGSGSRNESAVELAKRMLQTVDNDLFKLSKMTLPEMTRFRGIGQAKAISISAALELGRRRRDQERKDDFRITSSKDAHEILYQYLTDLDHEQFYVILLDRANQVIDTVRISQGGVSGTVADAKLIFRTALEKLASGIILAHNHPSGNLQPSQADIQLTKNLKSSGKLLEISVLDHLIITDRGYTSFADDGIL